MAFPQTSVATAQTGAFAGMLAEAGFHDIRSYVSEESTAEIPFGVMVAQGAADNGCLALATVNDDLIGVVVHSHAYNKDTELGDDGLKPTVTVNVLVRGRIWVQVEEAVTPASSVMVRAVVAGQEVAGAFRDTADASDLIDISAYARYVTTAGAGELAIVEIDMTNRSA